MGNSHTQTQNAKAFFILVKNVSERKFERRLDFFFLFWRSTKCREAGDAAPIVSRAHRGEARERLGENAREREAESTCLRSQTWNNGACTVSSR